MSSVSYLIDNHKIIVDADGYTIDDNFYSWIQNNNFNIGLAGHIYELKARYVDDCVEIKLLENHFILGFGDKTERTILFNPDYIQTSIIMKTKALMFWDTCKSNIARIYKQKIKYRGLLNFLARIRSCDVVNARSKLLIMS